MPGKYSANVWAVSVPALKVSIDDLDLGSVRS